MLATETFLSRQSQADPAEVVQQNGRLKVTGKFRSRKFRLPKNRVNRHVNEEIR